MFDFDHLNARGTYRHNINFVRLQVVGDGEREIRQENPYVVARGGF